MFCSHKVMYTGIDNEKILVDKRLELIRYVNENGINIKKELASSYNLLAKYSYRCYYIDTR